VREQIISHSIEIIQKMLLSERTLNQGGMRLRFGQQVKLAFPLLQTGETLVCARADGEPLQPQSLTHQLTRLITRIEDLPRIRLHDLRHSHATQLLAAGVHPKIVQERPPGSMLRSSQL
jgi:integrase